MGSCVKILGAFCVISVLFGFKPCPEKSAFSSNVIDSNETNKIVISTPGSSSSWSIDVYHARLGLIDDATVKKNGQVISISNLDEGEYFLKLESTEGCKVVLGDSQDMLKGITIGNQ